MNMSRLSGIFLGVTVSAAVVVSACSKENKNSQEDTKGSSAPETPVAKVEPTSDGDEAPADVPDASFARDMMKSYEDCRALLAADQGEGIAECANEMVAAAKVAHATAPEAAHGAIDEIVKSLAVLAQGPADDLEVLRMSFGEVSQGVVAMLTSAPEAGKSYHVFECPMAKGYKRWAQPDDKLANPYMGPKMLACGSEVHDPT